MIENDNLSSSLIGVIPEKFKDNNEFLDIISWNLRWFNEQDPVRVDRITEILTALNSDIFVFQEISEGSLDAVAAKLNNIGAGSYRVKYGKTGGDQRIAIMYDYDWVRTKDEIKELFGKGNILTVDGKDAFPRLPLWGYFVCKSSSPNKRGFDFQLTGVHLKSQMGGGNSQRSLAGDKLAYWLQSEASSVDSDTIIIGDWNNSPKSSDWSSIFELEKKGVVKFREINDDSDFSHLYYVNKNHIGSKLDIAIVTSDVPMQSGGAQTIRWVTLDKLLDTNPKAAQIKAYITEIKSKISDHMPIFTRYYMTES